MFKKIILPVDGTKNADKSVKYAVKVADNNAQIFILYATDSKFLTSIPEEAFEKEELDEFHKHGEIVTGHVANLIKEAGAEKNITTKPIIEESNPSKLIVKTIDDVDADAIVISSSGKNIVDRLLIGSVTEKIIYCSTVPVIVIPSKIDN